MKPTLMPKKSLGQHFLRCGWVATALVKAAEINSKDIILEIGPGRGELTYFLASAAKKVIAVEKDERLAQELKQKLAQEKITNVKIITGDALTWISKTRLRRYKVVSNIPYYLTSRLLRTLLESKSQPELIALTI